MVRVLTAARDCRHGRLDTCVAVSDPAAGLGRWVNLPSTQRRPLPSWRHSPRPPPSSRSLPSPCWRTCRHCHLRRRCPQCHPRCRLAGIPTRRARSDGGTGHSGHQHRPAGIPMRPACSDGGTEDSGHRRIMLGRRQIDLRSREVPSSPWPTPSRHAPLMVAQVFWPTSTATYLRMFSAWFIATP